MGNLLIMGRGGWIRSVVAENKSFRVAQVRVEAILVVSGAVKTVPEPCPFRALFVLALPTSDGRGEG